MFTDYLSVSYDHVKTTFAKSKPREINYRDYKAFN